MSEKIPSGWYFCMESKEIKPGKLVHKKLFNKNLVFWRAQSGKLGVCDDVCPHLGSRLSKLGRVAGENIQCFSHKYTYDQKGNCVATGFKSLPCRRMGALKHYQVEEKGGYVLFWHDHNDQKPTWAIPENLFNQSSDKHFVKSQFIFNVPIEIINEDNFDVGHLYSWHKVKNIVSEPVKVSGPKISIAHNFERHSIVFEKPLPKIISWAFKPIKSRYSSTLYGHGLTFSLIDIFNLNFQLRDVIWCTPIDSKRVLYTTFLSQVCGSEQNIFYKKLKNLILDPLIFRACVWRLRQEHKLEGHGYWENQEKISSPILTAAEKKLIIPYRKWCEQFSYGY
jgi:nitrite reductase/ring-hydroxylating ferredoxin subunit